MLNPNFCVYLTTLNRTAVTYYSKYLFLIIAGLTFSTTSYGQEGNLPVTGEQQERPVINPGVEPAEEGMQLWDERTSTGTVVNSEKSTVAETPQIAGNSQDGQKVTKSEGDDSVLSFNFLYYLFQKFKLSENVE